jgi:hypothetical protein
MTRPAPDANVAGERHDGRERTEGESGMKNVERALIATGVALVFSGGIASASILWSSATAEAAQPSIPTQLAAQIGTNLGTFADRGPKGPGGDLMTAAAAYIGIPAADLKAQLVAGKSLADIAVANGKTRDGLIAALLAAEQQEISALVDQKGVATFPGAPGLRGPGKDGRAFFDGKGEPLAAAATFLGTTTADLRTKLASGQTLAQIATAAGKTRDALIQTLVASAKANIEQAKTDGKLTADQATQLENGLTDRMTKIVDTAGAGHR